MDIHGVIGSTLTNFILDTVLNVMKIKQGEYKMSENKGKSLIEYILILIVVMMLMFFFVGSSWTGKHANMIKSNLCEWVS